MANLQEAPKYDLTKLRKLIALAETKIRPLTGDYDPSKINYLISYTVDNVGDYNYSTNTLRISANLSEATDEDVFNVIYHEFGHFIAESLIYTDPSKVITSESFTKEEYNLNKILPKIFNTEKYLVSIDLQHKPLNLPNGSIIYVTTDGANDPQKGHGELWLTVINRLNTILGCHITQFYEQQNVLDSGINYKEECQKCGWVEIINKTSNPQKFAQLQQLEQNGPKENSQLVCTKCKTPVVITNTATGKVISGQPERATNLTNNESFLDVKQFNSQLTENSKNSQISKLLKEDTRVVLVNKSRTIGLYKDMSHGKNRFDRKRFSKVAPSVKEYNKIDMNELFKRDTLLVGIPVIGETDSYLVEIKIEGVIAELAKSIKSNGNKLEYKNVIQSLTKTFNTSDVFVKCSCPDYKYRFAHWNIIHNNSVDDTSKDPGPGKNLANPSDNMGRGCKHVLLVLANGDWMMKVASVINNYIHYASEHMQKPFLKLIFPKLYGVTADEAAEAGLVESEDDLESKEDLIKLINDWARVRGRYKKGSNINPVQADRLEAEQKAKKAAETKQPVKSEQKPIANKPEEPEENKNNK